MENKIIQSEPGSDNSEKSFGTIRANVWKSVSKHGWVYCSNERVKSPEILTLLRLAVYFGVVSGCVRSIILTATKQVVISFTCSR